MQTATYTDRLLETINQRMQGYESLLQPKREFDRLKRAERYLLDRREREQQRRIREPGDKLEQNRREHEMRQWSIIESAASRWLDLADKPNRSEEEEKLFKRTKRYLTQIAINLPQTYSVPGMEFVEVVLKIRQVAIMQRDAIINPQQKLSIREPELGGSD